ncbi:uncharacterized protein F5Z01DRAFT_669739 [Emericellopsis atlantica]|uniref:Uncharacterized protein n=1 Tax=Emericellopsis atlantica TaxID=2614577 RepID=A0A9P8CUG3_9HYPO|nr:uncharacterized protein F5Z01DRAFT_669739 [Emericellopsis atlantica]KAG9259005.1 hypothetical protein F5Z01DRAFT_669739 [Emericellopsis atlantica]
MSITSFEGPFPTDFSVPDGCSHITGNSIFGFDFASSCLPDDFNPDPQAYYSPGTGCPSGYTAHEDCTRSSGGTTTVTCCPSRGDIELWCVSEPGSLVGPWESMQCTWSAGDQQTVLLVTTDDDATVAVTMTGADGINAYGLRMVYEPSDLEGTTATTTEASSTEQRSPSTPQPTDGDNDGADANSDESSDKGSSNTVTIAVAVVVPVVLIALGIAFFLWYRRRKSVQNVELPAGDSGPDMGQQWPYHPGNSAGPQYAADGGFSTSPSQHEPTAYATSNHHVYQPNELTGDNGHSPSQIQPGWSQQEQPPRVYEMMAAPPASELQGDEPRGSSEAKKTYGTAVSVRSVPGEGTFGPYGDNIPHEESQAYPNHG